MAAAREITEESSGLADASGLADFRVTVAANANETFGAGSHGGHDDLVVALAVWPNATSG